MITIIKLVKISITSHSYFLCVMRTLKTYPQQISSIQDSIFLPHFIGWNQIDTASTRLTCSDQHWGHKVTGELKVKPKNIRKEPLSASMLDV